MFFTMRYNKMSYFNKCNARDKVSNYKFVF